MTTTPPGTCSFVVSWQHRSDSDPIEPTEDQENPGHMRYRAVCSCGDTTPWRSKEAPAAEDGADHAFPGWRDLPVMQHRPYDNRRAETTWEAEARRVYPKGWFERGGPVITYRSAYSMRPVEGRAPGGGYDIGRLNPRPATSPRQVEQSEQATLF